MRATIRKLTHVNIYQKNLANNDKISSLPVFYPGPRRPHCGQQLCAGKCADHRFPGSCRRTDICVNRVSNGPPQLHPFLNEACVGRTDGTVRAFKFHTDELGNYAQADSCLVAHEDSEVNQFMVFAQSAADQCGIRSRLFIMEIAVVPIL